MTSKYAADIEEIKMAQVKSAAVLDNFATWQTEMLIRVREIAQCTKQHDREIVALKTWQTGHKENHKGIKSDISSLRKRINAAATANALWAPVASVIAVVFGQQQ